MKKYYITNDTSTTVWNSILTEIDNGNIPEIHCGFLDDKRITMIAGLGLPIYVKVEPSNHALVYITVESLRLHCVEHIFLSYSVDLHSRMYTYDFIGDVLDDGRLDDCKIVFTESNDYVNSSNRKLSQNYWNNLIIHCIDHKVLVCWDLGSNERFKNYMKMNNDR